MVLLQAEFQVTKPTIYKRSSFKRVKKDNIKIFSAFKLTFAAQKFSKLSVRAENI